MFPQFTASERTAPWTSAHTDKPATYYYGPSVLGSQASWNRLMIDGGIAVVLVVYGLGSNVSASVTRKRQPLERHHEVWTVIGSAHPQHTWKRKIMKETSS